jgi:hypothetical protein
MLLDILKIEIIMMFRSVTVVVTVRMNGMGLPENITTGKILEEAMAHTLTMEACVSVTNSLTKLCGCKEPCFEVGEQWGHLEGVLCKHSSEKPLNGEQVGTCGKTGEVVRYYGSESKIRELEGE